MSLSFAPLFSGSSGNATLISCGSTTVLVDSGVSCKRVMNELNAIDIDPSDLSAILVTHEHDDHIKGIGVLSRKFDLPIFATDGTWAAMEKKIGDVASKNICLIEPGKDFYFGDLNVMPFTIPHDAARPCGYSFENFGTRFTIATDIGCIRDKWLDHVLGSDAVLLESNYDPGMLEAGKYPYHLKYRIKSNHGHLCNDDAAEVARRLAEKGTRQLILGHLSTENNYPDLALTCTRQHLIVNGIIPDEDIMVEIAKRDNCTGYYTIDNT